MAAPILRNRSGEFAARRLSGRIFRAYRRHGRLACCRNCLGRFAPSNRKNALYCSRDCYFSAKAIRSGWRRLNAAEARVGQPKAPTPHRSPWAPIVLVPCRGCPSLFPKVRPFQHYCDPSCRRQHIAKAERRQRRSSKALRRARMRGVDAEAFDPREIMERDGWRCQICRRKTKPDASPLHASYPTLDHIIPLSKGGPHTRQNTQCACRRCNMAKSDDAIGYQQRLMG